MYNIEGNKLCYFIIFSAWKDCFCLTKKTKKTSKLLTSLFCSAAKCALVQSELERQD